MADYDTVDTADAEGMEGDQAVTILDLPDMGNIAEILTDEHLGRIGERVIREYEIDKASRSDWEKRIKAAMDIAMQVAEEKSYPWPRAANVKFPLMTVAAIQFGARAMPAIVAPDPVKAKVVGSDRGVPAIDPQTGQPIMGPDGQPAWQVPPGAKRHRADRVAAHMSYQLTEEMEEWAEDTDKLLHILPIVGCCFRKTYFDPGLARNVSCMVPADRLVVNYRAKSLEQAARITEELTPLHPHEVEERKRQGIWRDVDFGRPHDAGSDDDAPHEFLEQHRLLDLDEDGYPEPYIVTVHRETAQVARIVARFDREGVMLNAKGQIARIEPRHYYTKYSFLPSPDGSFYDVGFGSLLNPINESVNSVLNQLLDAGHLANTQGGFVGAGLRLKGGDLRFRPGEWKQINASGSDIRAAVVPITYPGPSAVLFNLLGLLIDAGREIANIKDVLSGDQDRTMPATTTMALIEQGMKVYTAIYGRIYRSLKSEYNKLFALNATYLDDEVYFRFHDDETAVARADYAMGDVDILPVADPREVSDMQKMARANFLSAFANDPLVNPIEVRRRMFEAASLDDIDALLVEPQPDPMAQQAAALELAEKQAKIEKAQAETLATLHQMDTETTRLEMDAYRMGREAATPPQVSNEPR